MTQDRNYTFVKTLRGVLAATMMLLTSGNALAQVTVHGNVFGGGNQADVKINTTVNISASNCLVEGNVYGGGNLGDVGTINKTNIRAYTWTDTDGAANGTAPAKNTGVCTVEITGGTIGTGVSMDSKGSFTNGNVFGAGKGQGDSFWCEKAMVYSTDVSISSGAVKGNVYGGGQVGRVETDAKVTIGGGTIAGNVFGAGAGIETHGYSALVRGNTYVKIQNSAAVSHNVYGGGQIAAVGKYKVKTKHDTEAPADLPVGMPYSLVSDNLGICNVTIEGSATITGNVYGACKGLIPHHVASGDDRSKRMMTYDSELYSGSNSSKWAYYPDPNKASDYVWEYLDHDTENEDNSDYLKFVETLALATQAVVDIKESAKVNGSVYGGSENGFVQHNVSVTTQGSCEIGTTSTAANVYGGGKGLATFTKAGRVSGNITLNVNGGTAHGSVFGGGELGYTIGRVDVNVTGGVVNNDVYGGGALADTNTGNGTEFIAVPGLTVGTSSVKGLYEKNCTYQKTGDTELTAGKSYYTQDGSNYVEVASPVAENLSNYYERTGHTYDIISDETTAAAGTTYYTNIHPTTVNLTGGHIKGDAYGGGLGQKTGFNGATGDIAAVVWGDIAVTLDGTKFDINKYEDEGYTNVVKSGRVFGCNNLYGSPQGNVTVTVQRTVAGNSSRSETANKTNANATYEVAAVYGGGNLADYTATGMKTHVIINGCSATSIQYVYGGGNAAAVPETDVDINATYEIGAVFGGGNGKDKYKDDNGWQTNLGANVNGNANTLIYGGTIHEAFGGSNEKGTISGSVSINTQSVSQESPNYCALNLGKLYGAGKNADIEGDLIVVMGCMPGDANKTDEVYGGAENANVKGNVELTITSGSFGKVFGGNNTSGAIFGHIILNIEESGCTPIKIDELYLGGYNAPYSVYGYYENGTIEGTDKPKYDPIISANDNTHTAVYFGSGGSSDHTKAPYADPVLNVISATYIGKVFGGGLGSDAIIYGNPTVNINQTKPLQFDSYDSETKVTTYTAKTGTLGSIGENGIFGGGNEAPVYGNTTVNIGNKTTVDWTVLVLDDSGQSVLDANDKPLTQTITGETLNAVLGANITGDVFGGGNHADVTGNTQVNVCAKENATTHVYEKVTPGEAGVTIQGTKPENEFGRGVFGGGNLGKVSGNSYVYLGGGSVNQSVYGGGCKADVLGNTFVTMLDGYVFDGVCGGGLEGSVGDFNLTDGKPSSLKTANTGKCTTVITGGQVGPVELATVGMGTAEHPAPISEGWVWGAGRGVVEDPTQHTDTHNKTYVDKTDVTIGGTAFILASVIGGGEFGRVLHDTNVTIQDHCQIGVGEGMVENGTPVRYTDGSGGIHGNVNQFVDPTTTTITSGQGGNALAPCSHFPYGKNIGTPEDPNWVYYTYDPYADTFENPYSGGSTNQASDGKTWIGCVFGGGSGYFPYEKEDGTGYDWVSSAGLVEGNTNVTITGGHILTNVYGGNEYSSVNGKCTVKMTGGTIGVPRTLEQIEALPMSGFLFGAGKGDPRSHFDDFTNVQNVDVEISGGIIYGSVYGGSEDGHVLGNVTINISEGTEYTVGGKTYSKPIIGTWGTSYYDGNVFGGGRGFSGDNLKAGSVGGTVKMNISGGKILGSIYGGGRMGSVGNDINIDISGGTIGNDYEFRYLTSTVSVPEGKTEQDAEIISARKAELGSYHIPLTDAVYDAGRGYYMLNHTKGGNVFGGGMGRRLKLDGESVITNWKEFGEAKSTQLTVRGSAWIKGNVFGGGEFGAVTGSHTTSSKQYGTEINISGGTIGTVMGSSINNTSISSEVGSNDDTRYSFGSVYGGGYGTEAEATAYTTAVTDFGALVTSNTYINMTDGKVRASVYGGGEMACISGDTYVNVSGDNSEIGVGQVRVTEGNKDYVLFGNWRMGNVFGGGKGSTNAVYSGLVAGNTNVNIGGGHVYHNVYGGGALSSVGTFTLADDTYHTSNPNTPVGAPITCTGGGTATVTITGGQIGINGWDNGMVNGSGRGDISETMPGSGEFDIYDNLGWVNNSVVTIGNSGQGFAAPQPQIKGTVYGGGENGHNLNNTQVTVHSGTIGTSTSASYENGNVFGSGCGTDNYGTKNGIINYNPMGGRVRGTTSVTIDGGHVLRSVYGAGSMASVDGGTTVTVGGGRIGTNGTVYGDVYGGPKGNLNANRAAHAGSSNVNISYASTPTTDDSSTTPLITGSVYGGGEAGIVKGSVQVEMTGGLVNKDIYGGGALADTNTDNWDKTNNAWAADKTSASNKTIVNVLGGSVRDVYGGGLGNTTTPAYVYGDTKVNLNGLEDGDYVAAAHQNYVRQIAATATNVAHYELKTTGSGTDITYSKGAIVNRLFGGNNLNGSPKGNTKVHVFATQAKGENMTTIKTKNAPHTALETGDATTYDVVAVYGGGNEAAYIPVYDSTTGTTTYKTQVIIEGCEYSSIKTVYGGGNAASVPETNVEIKSAYEIENVYGGGNGKDKKSDGSDNPGADVGQYNNGTETVTYGTGNANTILEGGVIHEAYGGSNQKGTIKGSINQTSDPDASDCTLVMTKVVGAGKYADIDADVNMILSCQPESKIDLLFAGADEANVNGNITLTITNGNFGKVFGGNNLGGAVKGKIVVNVEETGCRPINIDELYLGGNQAAYSVFGYYESDEKHKVTDKYILKPRESATDSRLPVQHNGTKYASISDFTNYAQPILNVISCTHIGKVFGGGYGAGAKMYADPTVNINMIPGAYASRIDRDNNGSADNDNHRLGTIDYVYGGGDAADIIGSTTVNIGTATTAYLNTEPEYRRTDETPLTPNAQGKYEQPVEGAYISGDVFGGGNAADVKGNTVVNVAATKVISNESVTWTDYGYQTTGYEGVKILGSVYGGGNLGSVGTFTTTTSVTGHSHTGDCIGKPTDCSDTTGKCTVNVGGYAEIGPDGMQMTKADGPDDTGYVFGASRGEVKDPAEDPDIEFRTYVYKTDVTIGGHAFIKGSVYGGSENGRVLNDTHVKIQDYCQIGNGENVNARYDEADFINPVTTSAADIDTKAATMAECAHWPYGVVNPTTTKTEYLPYDKYSSASGGTTSASDGHTFYGNVFGGGSGLYPYLKKGTTNEYEWLRTAGRVEGNTNVTITGGHILTSVYGGCELTDVGNGLSVEEGKGKCIVKMSGGTLGVPRTLAQIAAHPVTCYLFGAGKGDQRTRFNQWTNVGSVEVEVSGGIIYGSVFGGGEDGHVLGSVDMDILAGSAINDNYNYPVIGTWGTSYVEGNVFGGGRGFGGDALTAGVVCGNVDINITGGTMLGSIYGGGRLGSVGTYLVPPTEKGTTNPHSKYGTLIPDGTKVTIDEPNGTVIEESGGGTHGHITIAISGGTIGNNYEYILVPLGTTESELATLKNNSHIPNTEFEPIKDTNKQDAFRQSHTKGGNVFAGSMGRLYGLDNKTVLPHWEDLGKAKSTKLTISGTAKIKSCVYGGGELGTIEGFHTIKNAANEDVSVSTEIIITGGTIGTRVYDDAKTNVLYSIGSVFGAGYGSTIEELSYQKGTETIKTYPRLNAGKVKGNTKISMQDGTVEGSVYGGGEVASITGSTDVAVSGGKIGVEGLGGPTMGNVYGGGKGTVDAVRTGLIEGDTKVNISGSPEIYHNIYGGGAYGSVGTFEYTYDSNNKVSGISSCTSGGKTEVTITGGTIGINGKENGMVFGSSRGDVGAPGERHDRLAWVNNTKVEIGTSGSESGPQIKGSVYGSGENGHTWNNAEVTIHSGTIGITDTKIDGGAAYRYRGNVYGGGCGTDTYKDGNVDKYNPLAGIVYGTTKITIDGGHVVRNVYGAGAMGSVGKTTTTEGVTTISGGKTTIDISGGTIGVSGVDGVGNVYGAARGDLDVNDDNFSWVRETEVNIKSNTLKGKPAASIKGSVFGGGEAGIVKESVKVEMTGGTIDHDVYGGGALANTQTSNWDATANNDAGGWASNKTSASSTTLVSLKGGTIAGNAYGGALGNTTRAAYVYGDVKVELNKNITTENAEATRGCSVNRVFGCNNLNGTPKGKVQVYVYATQNADKTYILPKNDLHDGFETLTGNQKTTYDVEAVYGGGNLSPYDPVDAYSTDVTKRNAAQTEVYIDGCTLTSIKYVYGGGNAASAPATYVRVDGAYEIEELFAGGNGKDDYVIDGIYYKNPGANVGYKNYTYNVKSGETGYSAASHGSGTSADPYKAFDFDNAKTKAGRQTAANGYMYGSGIAHLEAFGCYAHAVYGGSNEKGNIRYQAWSKYEEGSSCGLNVLETYGGGKNSEIDGAIKLDLGCTKYMPEIFGGSKNADVFSDIELNIANGHYDNVFGGNNTSGNINGSITVNIKEDGCVPIEIDNLYLGGYLAGYSIYGYKNDGTVRTKAEYEALSATDKAAITVRKNPRINVISATSIGNIFGGGYQATVVGDPYVNVNMEQGRVEVKKTLKEGSTTEYIYKDENGSEYDSQTIQTIEGKLYSILPIGSIGNIYGGGNEADIIGDTHVEIGTGKWVTLDADGVKEVEETLTRNAATITGNVFGGGKGKADDFMCEKAMVGTANSGLGSTYVTIGNGTVGTLKDGKLQKGTGNVYGGGQIGRVEANTSVTIGIENDETNVPVILGNVFGAGAGLETHGYSALVRGNATVTVQGKAKVEGSVYGGGEIASVGRFWVKNVNNLKNDDTLADGAPEPPTDLPDEMPYALRSGGTCTVNVKGEAEITGDVFGAGMGMVPNEYDYITSTNYQGDSYDINKQMPKRMVVYAPYNSTTKKGFKEADKNITWTYYKDYDQGYTGDKFVWEYFDTVEKYHTFLQTLAIVNKPQVTIDGSATVKGSVYGGSESGFVLGTTSVTVQGDCTIGTTDAGGNVFGGGLGLATYAEAGRVRGNTNVIIKNGNVLGNVYGGGSLGDVGTIDKSDTENYNYKWKQTGGSDANTAENNKITGTNNNTGICTVEITGGTIGFDSPTKPEEHGNVFGAGKGLAVTWWCEKAMAFATNVSIKNSSTVVKGNVYGGGQIGRVEDDAKVEIGTKNGSDAPDIKGSVFGAGAGIMTHGYSALVRGNSDVTIQGSTKVGGSVYGGGEIASVGKFTVVNGLPTKPETGGCCTVTIQDNAIIGSSGTGDVYGACKGVTPAFVATGENRSKSMQLYKNRPSDASLWAAYDNTNTFIWRYYATEDDYLAFLKTMAQTSHPHVTIAGEATIHGSVFGGGQRGVTLGNVDVDINGGTVDQNVYGGGALADSNTSNWDLNGYVVATALKDGESITDLYGRTGSGTTADPYKYTKITDSETQFASGTYYRQEPTWADPVKTTALYTTTVDLKGGSIGGDAYGGGLGEKTGFNGATSDIPATVYGDITVNLGTLAETEGSPAVPATATKFNVSYEDTGDKDASGNPIEVVRSGRVFGCNNLNGSPQGNVTVNVYKTVKGNVDRTEKDPKNATQANRNAANHTYEVAAVYGGGNLADYTATGKKANVTIHTCDISVQDVYGGGNAAKVPETDVFVKGAWEINHVFGGGNGKDKYKQGNVWKTNEGADVTGNTKTLLIGGYIHEAFGGSNEKGTIGGNINFTTNAEDATRCCDLDLIKIVGSGKNAEIWGDIITVLGCQPETPVDVFIGGADNADVHGNVELTITSGTFRKVFGGNNIGGIIEGHIKVNIEETGCRPIIIDELYGCGNDAAYSVYGYKQQGADLVARESLSDGTAVRTPDKPYSTTQFYANPEVNVISCTKIGKVFGGGLGSHATVHGNPTVNINQTYGKAYSDQAKTKYDAVATTLGEIGVVFGGGNEAGVQGNTTVNIGTEKGSDVYVVRIVDEGTSLAGLNLYTRSKNATTGAFEYTAATGKAAADTYYYEKKTVLGANITGNVYGGGNEAEVTGDTNVYIGKKKVE